MAPSMMNDADAISRFNREAQCEPHQPSPRLRGLRFRRDREGSYLAMEYIEGQSLSALLDKAVR
jgi:hypothetical protein